MLWMIMNKGKGEENINITQTWISEKIEEELKYDK